MLFLPDKSYYALNPYEAQLVYHDRRGTRTILRSGQMGNGLVYMPSGGLIANVNGVGQYEYFPTGAVRASEISHSGGESWTRYIFDRSGNTYYFEGGVLYRLDPLGTVTSLGEDVDCPLERQIRFERIAFSETSQALYAACRRGTGAFILRYSTNGEQAVFYDNPHNAEHATLDVDIQGNVYYAYHRIDTYAFELVKLDRQGKAVKLFSKAGPWGDEGMAVLSCAKTGLDSYLILSPFQFAMYRVLGSGDVEPPVTDYSVIGVDFTGIETSPEGDVYVLTIGILYRFSESEIAAPVAVSDSLQQVTASVGSITDVVIPGSGFTGDTAVEIDGPGCWVYQRAATSDSLTFKLAVRADATPGEYDIILHHPGQAPVVLKDMLRIK